MECSQALSCASGSRRLRDKRTREMMAYFSRFQLAVGGGGGRESVPAVDESVRAGGAVSRVLIAVNLGMIDPFADPLFGKSATRAPTQPEQVPWRRKRCTITGGGDVATLPQLVRTMPRQPRGNKMF